MGGQIEKTENWGRRKLAYEIGHHKEGTYVLEVIIGSGELMKEIDRRLKVIDLRHPSPGCARGRGQAGRRAHAQEAHRGVTAASRCARPAARTSAG